MTYLGVKTKSELNSIIRNTKWNIGEIINYRSTVPTGGNNYAYIYGHTQIYTGAVLNTSNGSPWASSFGSNYGCGMVYNSRNSDSWEVFIFVK
jgi:hypothetical protein